MLPNGQEATEWRIISCPPPCFPRLDEDETKYVLFKSLGHSPVKDAQENMITDGRGDSEVYSSPIWLVGFRDYDGKETTEQYLLIVFIPETVELNGCLFFILFFSGQSVEKEILPWRTRVCPSSASLILNVWSRYISFPSSGDENQNRLTMQKTNKPPHTQKPPRAILAKVKQERKGKKGKRRRRKKNPYGKGNGQKPEAAQHFCLSVPWLGRGDEVVIQDKG